MKVKCPNCGSEDEGNFRSHCGTALPKLAASSDASHTKRHFIYFCSTLLEESGGKESRDIRAV